ncbi:hypothetical protein SAMN04488066_10382 [Halorubrum aquaticum]|uniref:Uncharacterized protein n=1 Tax=Halorubrum aquaticum TaxID=387340 RepID=A0A1I2ZSB2_9EURY|nr:hypothetical protein [Halorubrum aquaticum]SFH40772.1 hypothetical protein SAMN04488066_10382 [Halorubrum aquaticum]
MSDHDASPADPEELDFTDDENVVEIGEGRYVVGTDGRPNVRRRSPEPEPGPADDSGFRSPTDPAPADEREPVAGDRRNSGAETSSSRGDAGVDRRAVSRWLADSFDDDGFDYGVDMTLHAKGSTARNRMVSNDVTATFDNTLSWFVSNAGPGTDSAEALGLLLVAADTPIDVPPVAIKRFAASQGLSANDSIGDLIRAAEEAGGFRIE